MYIALSVGKRSRDLHFWHWKDDRLWEVQSDSAPEAPKRGPVTVLGVDTPPAAMTARAERLGYPDPTLHELKPGALRERLYEDPFVCLLTPDDAARQQLAELAPDEGDLFVTLTAGRDGFGWLWDGERLRSVSEPRGGW